ncbi:MAG: hypothetical protein AB7E85_04850 [Pseudobdellovibrionaceae bacterium]
MQTDLLSATRDGYATLWQERQYVMRLAVIPLTLKIVFYFIAVMFEVGPERLYFTIIMLPALFAEGWFHAQFMRTVLTGERWPIKIEGRVDKHFDFLLARARGILACIIAFVLIAMLKGGAMVGLTQLQIASTEQAATGMLDSNPLALFLGLALIGAALWGFRLVWIYVPLVVLMPLRTYLKGVSGMMSSIQMIVIWLLSVIPLQFLLLFFASMLLAPYGGEIAKSPAIISFLFFSIILVGESISRLIAATAIASYLKPLFMAYGLRPGFAPKNEQD